MVLNRFGFGAIYTPWRTVYVLKEHDTPALRRHELCHDAQRQRLGFWRFWLLISWWYLHAGHEYSPLEHEARQAEALT